MEQVNFEKDKWVTWLGAKGLSPRTIKEYCFYFDKFNFETFTQSYLNEFIVKHNNLVARAFLKNLLHYIKTNEFPKEIKVLLNEIEIPKFTGAKKVRLPNVLSPEQVQSIANAMNNQRNKFMVLISFYGGLRREELLTIKPYDFNWDGWLKNPGDNGRLRVIGKRNKQRGVFIPQEIMAQIYQWIKSEVSKRQSKDEPIFNIGENRWKDILHKASVQALGKHINPHLLRHSCGSWLRDNGWDLKEIAEYLGHDSIQSTQIYTHISQEKLKDKFSKLIGNNGQE